MNERIKELAEQAKEVVFSSPSTGRTTKQINLEKFAELLIRECIDQIDDGNSDHAGGNIDAINRIKEHFALDK